jgi:asparagine synthase (glutamine-hydrolysing)
MCGIAGVYSFGAAPPPGRGELARMIGALKHRGPDGSSIRIDGPAGLAHARLSIIDLEGGWQPVANEDESVWVVFNGEIFNYLELRPELEKRGHRFRTRSDTEVIVHLYEDYGLDFVDHLNGQFAIALWDQRRGRLVLARDRTGIRPLFYTRANGRLAFASEVKALFTLPEVPRRLDVEGLASTFSYWSVLPPKTVFDGVFSLPPGHRMVVEQSGTTIERYWDWSFPDSNANPFDEPASAPRSEGDCAEELRALLIDAVRLQLRSDVPVGAYLSGGLDSSIITTIIKNHTATPLRTFSLTFDDPEFDESAYQQELVRHLGTEHSSQLCRRADIGAAFARTVWHAETPLVRSAPTPMMLLAGSVRAAGYKVVLTGEGADEMFGGYDIFKEAKIRRFWAQRPSSTRRASLLKRLYPYMANLQRQPAAYLQAFFHVAPQDVESPLFSHLPRFGLTSRLKMFFSDAIRSEVGDYDGAAELTSRLPAEYGDWHPFCQSQYLEVTNLLPGYLLSSQGDRMAMAHGIEGRFPFLDHRLIELANRIPPRLTLKGLTEKYILRKAAGHLLPASIGNRTKQPYRAPDSQAFAMADAPDYVRDLMDPRAIERTGLFNPTTVQKLVAKAGTTGVEGFRDNTAYVGILSTQLWDRTFSAQARGALTAAA